MAEYYSIVWNCLPSSSNIYPENATANGHDFQMFSFEETTSCKACQMLLRWESERMGLGPGLGQHFLFKGAPPAIAPLRGEVGGSPLILSFSISLLL